MIPVLRITVPTHHIMARIMTAAPILPPPMAVTAVTAAAVPMAEAAVMEEDIR